MNFFVSTFGCKVNQYESQVMLESLVNSGFAPCEHAQSADIIVVNSCTVTSKSDQKVRHFIGRIKRENPGAILVLTGCMPQAFPQEAAGLAGVDIILGNANRRDLVGAIRDFLDNREKTFNIKEHEQSALFERSKISGCHERTRAVLKIEDGCNRFCSYCIIPYARGRVRSKPLADIKKEVADLALAGYKEIVLVGINLSAYGQDLETNLCEAVESVCKIDGIERVRLGSMEPDQLDEAAIKRLAAQEKLCPHFHLSLQSGCERTLARMGRHYTPEDYARVVHTFRENFDNCAITTDVMVGFPGETDDEFQESLKFVKRIDFAKVHVFPYSVRPGTKAANFKNQLPSNIKKIRSKEMIKETQASRETFLQSQIGREEDVLFETKEANGAFIGYTKNYTPVQVTSQTDLSGQIKKVKILKIDGEECVGEV